MDQRITTIKDKIRAVPDFPKPGILFRDITPLLGDAPAFQTVIDLFAERYASKNVDQILAIESRGFLFGAPLALKLGVPLNIARKPGKLPWKTDEVSYSLEYGEATLQVQKGDLKPGASVLIIDDLLATGGTAKAACQLVERQDAKVAEVAFVIELSALAGRERLSPTPIFALLDY
jgi:adenine phosphoribosyltransferase